MIDKARSKDAKRAARAAERSSTRSASPQSLPDLPARAATMTPELHSVSDDGLFDIDDLQLACLGFQDAFGMDGASLSSMQPDTPVSMPRSTCDETFPLVAQSPTMSFGAMFHDGLEGREGGMSGVDLENTTSGCHGKDEQLSVDRPFSLPLDMIGLNYFLAHYVVRQSHPASGFLDYTFPILARENGHELLEGAILAVGFAGLAHTMRQSDLMSRSIMMYTRTMKHINLALADPVAARRDSTIVTVLVLALYEFGRSSLQDWTHHIQGAATLLALRGKGQFSTPVGAQIFSDVFSFLLTNCLLTGSPIPSGLRMLRIEALKTISSSDVQWVASSAVIELVDLYQQLAPNGYNLVSQGSLPTSTFDFAPDLPRLATLPVESAERYLSQALEIDHRLECRFAECAPEWQYTVMQGKPLDTAFAHGDGYHLYPDICVANVWNTMRAARILANHAIGHLLLRGASIDSNWFFSNQYADRLQQVTKTIGSIRNDMIASIPQLVGHVNSFNQQGQITVKGSTPGGSDSGIDMNDASSTSSSTSGTSPYHFEGINYSGSAISGYFASWTLLIVGCLHNLGDDTRAWTVNQLRHVSSQSGLAQADEFAHCIEANQLRPPLS